MQDAADRVRREEGGAGARRTGPRRLMYQGATSVNRLRRYALSLRVCSEGKAHTYDMRCYQQPDV